MGIMEKKMETTGNIGVPFWAVVALGGTLLPYFGGYTKNLRRALPLPMARICQVAQACLRHLCLRAFP